jgi:hypothetical protein
VRRVPATQICADTHGVPLDTLSPLALSIWQYGLKANGASVFTIAERLLDRGLEHDAEDVSKACRELVAAGRARQTPFGYLHVRAKQGRLFDE